MENFLFKESALDFDYILEKNEYKVTKDYETYVLFSKNIKIENKHSDKLKSIDQFCIEVSRAKVLPKSGKYSICSPYSITFIYGVMPLHAIRRIKWDTFPGDISDVLDAILKIVEAEAKICAYNFMETDIQIMQRFSENEKSKVVED